MTRIFLVGSTVEKLPFGSNPTAPLTHCNCRTLDDDNHHYVNADYKDDDSGCE